jgi:hypothetical protein
MIKNVEIQGRKIKMLKNIFLDFFRFLGSRAVAVLNHWFQSNREYPYPDDERTDQLANEAGITQKQVKKWFANKRVRSQMCYKPLYRSRKVENVISLIHL